MQIRNYPYSPTNVELVEACLGGNAAAWDTLVERYARLVRSVPARHGLAREDIEDITQDVFLQLARNLDQIQDAEAIGKWLLVTARHRSLRVAQKSAMEQPALDGDLMEYYPKDAAVQTLHPVPGVSELTELWAQREMISYGLEKIGQRCRQLLYMLFLDPEQPSYDLICDELKMAKGSIGPTRQRCLAQLRTALEEVEQFSVN